MSITEDKSSAMIVDEAEVNEASLNVTTPESAVPETLGSTADSTPKHDESTLETVKQEDNQTENAVPSEKSVEGEDSKPEDEENKEKEDDDDEDESDDSNYTDFTISADDDSDEGKDSTQLLSKAAILKEEGNTHFKSDDLVKAYRSYRKGINLIKSLNEQNTGDEQVKALLVTLQTNLSMVCFKQDKPKMSMEVASRALAIDNANVKALFRRATAHRKLGDTDKARADLKTALKHDPTNMAVKRELLSIKKSIEDATRDQKNALQKAFSSNGSLLYDDKIEEERRKAEEKRRKQEEEKEALKKRKVEWEDECVKRMANDQPAISFDEWDKQRKKREKSIAKLKKQEEDRVKEEKKKAKAETTRKEDTHNDSDEELSEKELSLLRGYKKTADGRTTSYFTREVSATDKHLIGDITPQRLGGTPVEVVTQPVATISPSPSTDGLTQSGKGRPSAWNHAGTWEEKDTTEWCRDRLKYRLNETRAESGPVVAVVTKVEEVTGEASVAITSGKKRYIFDLHTTVEYEIRDSNDDEVVASGSLRLPDVCSTSHEELEVEVLKWTKAPPNTADVEAIECRQCLVSAIRENVKAWVTDFNEEF